jgi:hypothetical protein
VTEREKNVVRSAALHSLPLRAGGTRSATRHCSGPDVLCAAHARHELDPEVVALRVRRPDACEQDPGTHAHGARSTRPRVMQFPTNHGGA